MKCHSHHELFTKILYLCHFTIAKYERNNNFSQFLHGSAQHFHLFNDVYPLFDLFILIVDYLL